MCILYFLSFFLLEINNSRYSQLALLVIIERFIRIHFIDIINITVHCIYYLTIIIVLLLLSYIKRL